jgi:hypothetical protein
LFQSAVVVEEQTILADMLAVGVVRAELCTALYPHQFLVMVLIQSQLDLVAQVALMVLEMYQAQMV